MHEYDYGELDLNLITQSVESFDKSSTAMMHNTVLHLALKSGNNRSVEILLDFLSKVKFDNSVNFVSIIDKLILFQNFKPFIGNLQFQTPFMQSK